MNKDWLAPNRTALLLIDMQVDFTTDNLLVKAWERYSFNYNDGRSLYGSAPTS